MEVSLPQGDCKSCGTPTSSGQLYCISCGNRLAEPPALASAAPGLEEARGPKEPAAPAAASLPPWLSWAALPFTDRRWAAPLAAIALGFGLFAGVAIGPGAAGTLAGATQVIKLPASLFAGDGDGTTASGSDRESTPPVSALAGPVGNVSGSDSTSASPTAPPVAPLAFPSPAPTPSTPAPEPTARPQPTSNPPPKHQPAPPKEETVEGTVVHTNPAALSYTVATGDGEVSVVHAAKLPTPSAKLKVVVRLLANGTYAEKGKRTTSGHADAAKIAGYVTFVDPEAGIYTISKRGVSALVHVAADAGEAAKLPVLGANATVSVEIKEPEPAARKRGNGHGWGLPRIFGGMPRAAAAAVESTPTSATAACAPDPVTLPDPIAPQALLWQQKIKTKGDPTTYSDFEGITEAICTNSGSITVSADDIREGSQDLVFSVPKKISLKSFKVGRSVELTSLLNEDGSLSLTGIARDDGIVGADDSSAAQGDLAG
jgi:hypothetical protein